MGLTQKRKRLKQGHISGPKDFKTEKEKAYYPTAG